MQHDKESLCKSRLFVDKVLLENDHIIITLANAGSHEFTLRGIVKGMIDGKVIDKTKENWKMPAKINFMLPDLSLDEGVEFTLFINDHLVYKNIIHKTKEQTV